MRLLRYSIIAIPVFLLAFASISYALSRISPGPNSKPSGFSSAIAPLIYIDRHLPPTLDSLAVSKLANSARTSLIAEPINPRALRMLALDSRARENFSKMLVYTSLSQRLSRRDGTTQMLLIEAKAKLPNTRIADILSHYDILLRVNPDLSDRLYPAIIQTMSNTEARETIASYVRKNNLWANNFLFAALDAENGPDEVADIILRGAPNRSVKMPDGLAKRLFDGLILQGRYETAKALFLRSSGANRSWLRSTDFQLADKQSDYGVLVWQFISYTDSGAELISGNNDRPLGLRLFALSGARGNPLRRLLFLSPGTYKITQSYDVLNSGANAQAGLTIKCAIDGEPLAQSKPVSEDIQFSVSATGKKTSTAIMQINCPTQMLEFTVAGGDNQSGLEIILDRLDIKRL